ncbi:MAG: ribbon-helix-helix domain-containing protein [Candidatus Woesearchaeota archaeon]|nr:ribbon-helix-helix domain-containing protein [Candidatus Woesearchaeota archaeon]
MTTELVTFKIDDAQLAAVDEVVQKAGFHSRTEFIRTTLREKVEEFKLKHAMLQLSMMRGKAPRKVSDKELHAIREKVFDDFEKQFK